MHHLFLWDILFRKRTKKSLTTLACLLLWASQFAVAQNLVPNPSFEDADHLPTYDNDFDINVDFWFRGNAWYPLLCHVNTTYTNSMLGFPNPNGFQQPRSGNACVIYRAMRYEGYAGFTYKRTYPTIKLFHTIPLGSKVYGEFYISKHEMFNLEQLVVNNHGMLFSKDSITDNGAELIARTPQINETQIITDSINWVKISGVFINDTELNYISIGNFYSNNNTQHILNFSRNPDALISSWYFLDDVKVRILNPQVPDTINVCLGDEATLVATGEENHQWAFAYNASQIVSTDSIFSFLPDSSQTVYFYGSFDTLQTFVQVDTLALNLGPDTLICSGTNFWLSPKTNALHTTLWSNGSRSDSIKITKTGIYWAELTSGACTKTDTVFVEVATFEPVELLPFGTACLGDSLVIGVTPQAHANYLWNTGSKDSAIVLHEDGTYWVKVSHLCGTTEKEVTVIFEKCVCRFFVPNAFSPNGDGINDAFFPVYDCSIRNYQIVITNRWGNEVFQSTDPTEHWAGENAQTGIYNVRIFYQGLNEEGKIVGDDIIQMLHLIR